MNNEFLVKKVMPALLVIVVAITALVLAYSSNKGGGKQNANSAGKNPNTLEPGEYDSSFTGVITNINEEENEMVLYNIKYESKFVLNYNGATDVRNKYDKVVAMSHMEVGQIVDAYYMRNDMKLVKLKESEKCWEYKNLTNFEFRESGNVIYINGKRYNFNQDISVTMDGVMVDRDKILQGDEIIVRGIDKDVYSIVVTKGHGTIKLDNYDELLGGLIMVGNYDAVEITENMSLEIAEGTYNIWFVKDKLKGEKVVTVSRNELTKVDVGDIYMEQTDKALVNFKITPSDAILYIDGIARKYNNAVELDYGTYTFDVEKSGYNSYSGKMVVDRSTVSIVVNLVSSEQENEDEEDKYITPKPTDTEENSNKSDQDTTENTTTPPTWHTTTAPTWSATAEPTRDTNTAPAEAGTTSPTNNGSGLVTPPAPQVPTAQVPTPMPEPTFSSDETQYADGSGGVG